MKKGEGMLGNDFSSKAQNTLIRRSLTEITFIGIYIITKSISVL